MTEYVKVVASREENVSYMNRILPVQQSFDLIQRDIYVGERPSTFYFIDGFSKDEVMLKPGVLRLLELCKKNGIKMGIATSNSRELMNVIAKTHGISDYISCIKTGSDITNGKPAPDIYLAVAEELQVEPSKCLVFEDITAGIKAGKAAGMEVCAVKDAYSMDSDREKHLLSDYYLDDYRHLNL